MIKGLSLKSKAKLKPTQIKVLEVLVNNKDKWMGLRDIQKQCSVNSNHIELAVKFLYENDLVFINHDGKAMVSRDGISVYNENI